MSDHLNKLRMLMQKHEWDVLIAKMPENVLYASSYWPVSGTAVAVLPLEGDPALIVDLMEQEYIRNSRIRDVRTFESGLLRTASASDQIAGMLEEIAGQRSLKGKKIGLELGFETLAPSLNSAEPILPSPAYVSAVRQAFGDRTGDAAGLWNEARAVKDGEDIDCLRRAHQLADIGLQAFKKGLEPGRTEFEIAAEIEQAVMSGITACPEVQHARAWAQVMSGRRSSRAYTPFPASSGKTIETGDIVVLELAVVADGYWADLTRTRAVGKATETQQAAYQAILKAHEAIRSSLHANAAGGEIDACGRTVIEEAGFGGYFPHITGHGLGFKYHEPLPFLHPDDKTRLLPGMVTSVEPGIYIPGEWGMRLEENAVITQDQTLYLSTFDTKLL